MSSYDCPRCQSNQTTSFAAIYEQGTRTNYGHAGGGSVSQSVLARQVSPPVKPALGCGMLTFLAAAPVFGSLGMIFFLRICLNTISFTLSQAVTGEMLFLIYAALVVTGLVGGFYLALRSVNRRLPAYQTRLRQWSLGMYCRRCGNVWQRQY